MAVFLAGGNEGPGKLCCSEQRDNSSQNKVIRSMVVMILMRDTSQMNRMSSMTKTVMGVQLSYLSK